MAYCKTVGLNKAKLTAHKFSKIVLLPKNLKNLLKMSMI